MCSPEDPMKKTEGILQPSVSQSSKDISKSMEGIQVILFFYKKK